MPTADQITRYKRYQSHLNSLGGSNALRAAVLGATDGLTSNLALVMGVAGASPGRSTVLLVGIAGLLAGSFSMGLGEWISVASSREAAEAEIALEREEIALMPNEERDELALIYLYRTKGLPEEQARALAAHLIADHDSKAAIAAREELIQVPEAIGSPWTASAVSFCLFATGAVIPLLPFFFVGGLAGIVASAAIASVALFLVGSTISLLTGRSAAYAGTRQLLLGLLVATITFAIGRTIGTITGP